MYEEQLVNLEGKLPALPETLYDLEKEVVKKFVFLTEEQKLFINLLINLLITGQLQN